MHDADSHACSTPRPIGAGIHPADLEAHEAEIAAQVAALGRVEAGPELHGRIQRALATDAAPVLRAHSGWSRPRLALAAAAALLVAIGALGFVSGSPDEIPSGELASEPVAERSGAVQTWVIEDPGLTLYHDLETFEGLGVAPGDMLALGDDR